MFTNQISMVKNEPASALEWTGIVDGPMPCGLTLPKFECISSSFSVPFNAKTFICSSEEFPFGGSFDVLQPEILKPEIFLYEATSLPEQETSDNSAQANFGQGKPYACEKCGRQFSYLANLHCHMRLHREGQPDDGSSKQKVANKSEVNSPRTKEFACDQCERKYHTMAYLSRHKRIHNGEMYACDKCTRKFRYQSSLCRHKKTHEGQIKAESA